MEIQSLSISERIILAEALWDSVAGSDSEIELSQAQKAELDKRLASFESDTQAGSSWNEVKARIITKK